jgi:hypothetical protein
MTWFLLSGTLGFIVYQCLAWANVPAGKPGFYVGGSKVEFSAEAATWARRGLRLAIAVLILGAIILMNRPFIAPDVVAKSEVAIMMGAFWGPLFAIWINAVIANAPGANLTRGQFVAGIGLALIFLIGSVGNETGSLLREYAKKISNLKIAGAEVSFSDRLRAGSPGAGAAPPSPGKPLVSGSAGLTYFADLDDTIARDTVYLDLFRRLELRDIADELARLYKTIDDDHRRRLAEKADLTNALWTKTQATLQTAKNFAINTVIKPANCLVGWYEVTGDSDSANRHLASYGDLFRRLQAVDLKQHDDSEQQIKQIAVGLLRTSINIGSDALVSIPGYLGRDKCNDLLGLFCPDELNNADRKPLRDCLQKSLAAAELDTKTPSPEIDKLREATVGGLQNFLQSDGVEGRPYFVIGYASILAQLTQYTAAGAVLDGWLQRRSKRTSAESWPLADDWFDIRVRSTLAAYMEEWIRKQGSTPPTKVLDVHIENLNRLLDYLQTRLSRTAFFAKIDAALQNQKETELKWPGKCKSSEPELEIWRRLFETYVSLQLTRVQAALLHFNYRQFSDETTGELTRLASIDLSCIPEMASAEIYAAQIMESFARNAMMYANAHSGPEHEEANKKRLSGAIEVAEFGTKLLDDAAKNQTPEAPDGSFLKRIEASELDATKEKLAATLGAVKKLRQDMDR